MLISKILESLIDCWYTYTKIPDLKAISGYKEETSFSRFALKETKDSIMNIILSLKKHTPPTVIVEGYDKQRGWIF